ncbi:MAG: phosphopantetheine-binding protein [Gemmatimonadota bacterium]|nr:phosphopantetheine-binding protein [Gemmatimonadota bacterium]
MTGTESRLVELMDEHLDLGREPDLNRGFADSGISSLNAVAFIKVVEREFDVAIAPEDCDKIGTLGKLIAYLDSKLG